MAVALARQIETCLDLVQMRGCKVCRLGKVTRIHRLEHAAMSLVRLGSVKIRLVQHRNKDGAGSQVAQQIGNDFVSGNFGNTNVEITHQACQPLAVASSHRVPFLVQVIEKNLATLWGQPRHAPQQTALDDAPRLVDFNRLFGRWLYDEPAATWTDLDDATAAKTHQRFAYLGARHAINFCKLTFAQPSSGAYSSGKNAGNDGLFYRSLVGVGCMSILHTRWKSKRCAN